MSKKSNLVSGRMFRVVITGEIPADMVGLEPAVVAATILGCVTLSLALQGNVSKVDFSMGELQPAGPPPGHEN